MEIMNFKKDRLSVRAFATRDAMGKAAAADAAACIKALLNSKEYINMIFAAAPSQNEVLKALAEDSSIEWGRINAYHMDEYIGLPADAPQCFGNFLDEHIFSLVPFRTVNRIDCTASDTGAEAARYSELLAGNPADIVIMGIGENGHIAFNDPPVADFCDPLAVKAVKLDPVCRRQQVNDGCFACIDDVPRYALTLTVPALTRAPHLFCVVPAPTKAAAVFETLNGTIDEHCPASVLRLHGDAHLYLDADSSSMLK